MRYLVALLAVACGSVANEKVDALPTDSSSDSSPADTTTATCATTPAGLRVRYRAENNTSDHGGNFNGTTVGTNFSYTPGKYGSAFQFDGVDDTVTINDGEQLWPSGSLTVEAWIKTTSTNDYSIAVCKYACGNNCVAGSSNSTFCLYTEQDGRPAFEFRREVGAGNIIKAKATLATVNDGAWHHLVGVRDATALAGSLYVDGVLATTVNPAAAEFGAMTNADNDVDLVTIGSTLINGQTNHHYWFAGAIDEVAIYHSALSAADVSAIYNARDGKCL